MKTVTAASNSVTEPVGTVATRYTRPEMPVLDGLRGCAVLMVVLLHLQGTMETAGWGSFPGLLHDVAGFGYVGVQLFFILSGFLLFLPYVPALLAWPKAMWPSARQFYVRRARRILPLYYVAVAVLLLAHFRDWPYLPPLLAPLYLIGLLVHDMRADATSIIYVIDPPLWSLAAEWQFYLVLPALAFGLRRIASRGGRTGSIWWLVGALACVILAGLGVRYAAGVTHYDGGFATPQNVPGVIGFAFKFAYGFRGKYIEEFALGMLASVVYVVLTAHQRLSVRALARLGAVCWVLGLLGLIAGLAWAIADGRIDMRDFQSWFFPASSYRLWAVFGEWGVALCFALVLLGALLGPSGLRRVFAARPLRFVGVISFSIYVWHYPILFALAPLIGWAQAQDIGWGAGPLYMLVALTAIAAVSVVSYRFIERPFLHRRIW